MAQSLDIQEQARDAAAPPFEPEAGGEVPVGVQLGWRLRALITCGRLLPGDRLPSVRELAQAAGVNVNTARAVYARLESEGVVRSEQGRGTFASGASDDDVATRRELRRQIAQLESALARLPPPPVLAPDRAGGRQGGATLLSTRDLEAVRDELLAQLRDLDAQRAALRRRLEQLGMEDSVAETPSRRATPSRAGARIRWVGA
jgi:DNA-binding transcriptional regulator YhcF (GntR family)